MLGVGSASASGFSPGTCYGGLTEPVDSVDQVLEDIEKRIDDPVLLCVRFRS
jgi:hypothetical protein